VVVADLGAKFLANCDMSFKYFLDLNPEDELVNSSLLTKFRKSRINSE
jgi:hypothetical protein